MPLSSRSIAWLSAAVIAATILVAYFPGLHTPFQYDDLSNVVENVTIRDLGDIGRVLSPPADLTSTAGRPLLSLVFAIDYAFSGQNVTGYHATNIALHVICALLLYAIVRATAGWPSVGLDAHAGVIAMATATIWAVHPLQTGVVTYISGRSESLMGLWYLATLLCAIRAHRSRRAGGWTVAAVVCCALGMASKESMVTAPFAVLLYDRAYLFNRFSEAGKARWRLYAGLFATLAIGIALALQAPRSESAGFSTEISPWTYLLNQAVIIPDYLRLIAWPDYLLFAYGEARQMTIADVGAIGLVVPALMAVAIWLWYRRPALGFPALWVFLTLAPTSSFVPIATEAGAARRLYLPLAGIVLLAVVTLVTIARRTMGSGVMFRGRLRTEHVVPVAIVVIAILLTATTAAQSREFASPEQLWRGSAEHWPSALAHRNLAAVLLQQGRRAEAVEELRAATERNRRRATRWVSSSSSSGGPRTRSRNYGALFRNSRLSPRSRWKAGGCWRVRCNRKDVIWRRPMCSRRSRR